MFSIKINLTVQYLSTTLEKIQTSSKYFHDKRSSAVLSLLQFPVISAFFGINWLLSCKNKTSIRKYHKILVALEIQNYPSTVLQCS